VLVENADGTAMAQVLFRAKGPLSVGYIPRGPVLAGDTGALWRALWLAIDDIARRRRAISVIVEPDAPLGLTGSYFDAGVVRGPDHVQPSRTVKVPLVDDDALLKQMHQKTRYNIRLAGRRGVEFRALPVSPETVAQFYGVMQDTAQRNEFAVHSLDYYADFLDVFRDDALLLGAWNDEGTLSAMLIAAVFGEEATYMYGASSTTHRAHGAGAALQFEAMKWARDRGAKRYDLWGIPAQDPSSVADDESSQIAATRGEDWRGLYRFKTGFGGQIVSFPPTLERRYVPLLPGVARRIGIIAG
jgi:lipid II:glycine glycyltransferase (peptidoglycan interpeptide bridge formation enzyme)